jgi:hypothetical protein
MILQLILPIQFPISTDNASGKYGLQKVFSVFSMHRKQENMPRMHSGVMLQNIHLKFHMVYEVTNGRTQQVIQ